MLLELQCWGKGTGKSPGQRQRRKQHRPPQTNLGQSFGDFEHGAREPIQAGRSATMGPMVLASVELDQTECGFLFASRCRCGGPESQTACLPSKWGCNTMCMHKYIHTYRHTYIHTHTYNIHTYIHAHHVPTKHQMRRSNKNRNTTATTMETHKFTKRPESSYTAPLDTRLTFSVSPAGCRKTPNR